MAEDISPMQTYVTAQKKKSIWTGLYGVWLLFIALCIHIYTLIFLREYRSITWISTSLIFVLYFGMRIFLKDQLMEVDRWKKGENGELAVKSILERLPESFVCFEDIKLPHGYGNVDHIIVGPSGVFSLETKNVKPSKLGWKVKYLPILYNKFHAQCYREAKDVERYLVLNKISALKVSPLLVLADEEHRKAKKSWNYRGVQVVPLNLLYEYIVSQPIHLGYDQIQNINQVFSNVRNN